MADETNNTEQTQETPDTPPESGRSEQSEQSSGNGERMFTQEELNRIVGERVRKAKEAARLEAQRQRQEPQSQQRSDAPRQQQTEQEPQQRAQDQESKKRPSVTDALKEIEELRLETKFDKIALRHGLSDKQAAFLFDLYKVHRPEDADAWVGNLRDGGLVPKPEPTQTRAQQPAQVQEQPVKREPPADGSPRKVPSLDTSGDINPFTLSREDAQRLGDAEIVKQFQSMRERTHKRAGRPPLPAALRRLQER